MITSNDLTRLSSRKDTREKWLYGTGKI